MPNLIKPATIIKEVTTQNGEVTVNLNITLTLQLDQAGNLSVDASAKEKVINEYHIPDVEEVTEEDLIDFGK
jgi:hypothetical protein